MKNSKEKIVDKIADKLMKDVREKAKEFIIRMSEEPSMLSTEDMLVKFYCDMNGIARRIKIEDEKNPICPDCNISNNSINEEAEMGNILNMNLREEIKKRILSVTTVCFNDEEKGKMDVITPEVAEYIAIKYAEEKIKSLNKNSINMETVEFYLVKNKEGKYLRSNGYRKNGESWTDDIKKARVYGTKNMAYGQITIWAHNYPERGVPFLVPLVATIGEPVDQIDRVSKSIKTKEIVKAESDFRNAKNKCDELYSKLFSNDDAFGNRLLVEKFRIAAKKLEESTLKLNKLKKE